MRPVGYCTALDLIVALAAVDLVCMHVIVAHLDVLQSRFETAVLARLMIIGICEARGMVKNKSLVRTFLIGSGVPINYDYAQLVQGTLVTANFTRGRRTVRLEVLFVPSRCAYHL